MGMTLLPFQTFLIKEIPQTLRKPKPLLAIYGPTENTHIRGLVPSVMPHVIHHAGEQVQAGWDVVREQEDAEGLKNK